MLMIVHWLSNLPVHAHEAARDDVDFQSCFYFSVLGLIVSLLFVHLHGAAALILLARAG